MTRNTLLYLLLLFISLTYTSCVDDDDSMDNPTIGNTYVVSEIVDKQPVAGFIYTNGAVRPMTAEEAESFDDGFSYTDLNDVNFVGNQIRVVSDNSIVYGRGEFATAFPYTFTDNVITVDFGVETNQTGVLEPMTFLRVNSSERLTRETMHYYYFVDGRTFGTDGIDYTTAFIDRLKNALDEEGELFHFQRHRFLYEKSN